MDKMLLLVFTVSAEDLWNVRRKDSKENEDCPYLNLYAPPPTANKRPKPVTFWNFGTNWQFGSARLER